MSISLADFPVVYEQDTQFSDLDPLKHVNNKAIVTYYENARTRLFMKLFDGGIFINDKGEPMNAVLVEVTVRYRQEVLFPNAVTTGSAVTKIGSSSFAIHQKLYQQGIECGSCDTVMVAISNGKSHPIPMAVRERMQQYSIMR